MERFSALRLFPLILLLAGWQCLVTDSSLADVRVVDANGLIRAIKVTDQPVTVRIVLSSPAHDASSVVLKQIDGVAPDIQSSLEPDGSLKFSGAPVGSWQIKNLTPKQIKAIEIIE